MIVFVFLSVLRAFYMLIETIGSVSIRLFSATTVNGFYKRRTFFTHREFSRLFETLTTENYPIFMKKCRFIRAEVSIFLWIFRIVFGSERSKYRLGRKCSALQRLLHQFQLIRNRCE